MKKLIIPAILMALTSVNASSQITDMESDLRTVTADSLDGWKKGATFNLGVSQTSLTNWAAGGENSFAVNGIFSGHADLTQGKLNWDNSLDVGYGVLKKGEDDFIKTDDKIDFASKLGYDAFDKWNYAALLNFRTQLAKGYNYPSDVVISKFLAPGYILGAAGLDYKPNDKISAFIAPITGKFTIVNDQALADSGAFGVDPGKMFRAELGGYVRMAYTAEIMKNVNLGTKIDLFSNYLHNPGNIDINWEALLSIKANKYLAATLATQLIYDDDIKIEIDKDGDGDIDAKGPRIQFKEVLSISFTLTF